MKPAAVIFDVDGTLVDVTSVRHHVLDRRRKNYDAFHHGSVFCPPIRWVCDEVDRHHEEGKSIIIVTAREHRWHALTTNWLNDAGVLWDEIHMRPTGDFRQDRIIKAELFDGISGRYDVQHAYDDNPNVIALWQELGIPTTVVPGWAEETG